MRTARRAARKRQVRRRRQGALLGVAGILVVVLAIWAAVGRGSSTSHTATASHVTTSGSSTATSSTTTTTGSGTTTSGSTSAASAALTDAPGPAHVRPMVIWQRTVPAWSNPSPWTGQPAAVLTTRLMTDSLGDRVTLAWFRQARTTVALYPGTGNPYTSFTDRGPTEVPLTARRGLVATFNSGFYEKDDSAGFYAHKTLYHAMVDGKATMVEYANGKVDIIRWTGGARPGSDVLVARQNLGMLVDDGHVSSTAGVLSDWGITWKGAYAVWRSALGIDKNGNLIYAAGPNQSVSSIATALIHAGAVRAMQLDINPEWPILVTFGAPGGHLPTLQTPNPNQIPSRFLYPSLKDFFTVYLRPGSGTVSLPW